VALDTQTGMVKPGETALESFRMDGVVVRREGDAPPKQLSAVKPPRHREKSHHKSHG
jgi:hypothetical protein